jgi:hypothetical protein
MAFKMKYKNLNEVVDALNNASKMHAKQAKVVKGHIEDMEKGSPHKKYASDAQRKAVWASKKDGGKGNPNKKLTPYNKLEDLNNDGEITKADVLVGRGVIDKEGNPLKKTKKRTLSASCKAAARKKFDVYPSAYANMWASRQQGKGKC